MAFVFNPIRLRLQNLIDRAFYGGRADPAGTARQIAAGLRQSGELTDVLERTRDALRLPWMALDQADGTRLAEAGRRSSGTGTTIDLRYRGSTVGMLHLQRRRGETMLHEADRGTLELICPPLAIALHPTALSGQVRQAHTATVEAAAAERLRLQRDLHDGLGPTLTSIAFRVDAAANTVRADTETAHRERPAPLDRPHLHRDRRSQRSPRADDRRRRHPSTDLAAGIGIRSLRVRAEELQALARFRALTGWPGSRPSRKAATRRAAARP